MVLTRCALVAFTVLIFAFHGIGFASSQASHEVKKVRTTCNILLSVYTCYLSVGKIAPVGCLKLILAVHPLLFSRCTSSTWGRDSTRTPITPLPRTTASWLQFSEGNPPKTKTYCFTSALHISFVNHNKTVHFSFVLTNFEARTRLPSRSCTATSMDSPASLQCSRNHRPKQSEVTKHATWLNKQINRQNWWRTLLIFTRTGLPGVVSVRMNQMHSTHTTSSWDFMGVPYGQPDGVLASAGMGEGVIIGVIDSGWFPHSFYWYELDCRLVGKIVGFS